MKGNNEYRAENKTPEEIANDIRATRERMDHTIDELSARAKPKHIASTLLQNAREKIKDSDIPGQAQRKLGNFGSRSLDQVRSHPGALLVAGLSLSAIGLALMVLRNTDTSTTSRLPEEDLDIQDLDAPDVRSAGYTRSASSAYQARAAAQPNQRAQASTLTADERSAPLATDMDESDKKLEALRQQKSRRSSAS